KPDTFTGMSAHTTDTEPGPEIAPKSADPATRHPNRIVIQYPAPSVDGGRYPVKRCVGDTVTVEADVFRDGHELIRTVVRYRGPGEAQWLESDLHRIDAHLGGVRWAGAFS